MKRSVIINFGGTKYTIDATPNDTIGSIKKILQEKKIVLGSNLDDFTLGHKFSCIAYSDSTYIYDLISFNHLFQIPLPSVDPFEPSSRRSINNIDLTRLNSPTPRNDDQDIQIPELHVIKPLKHNAPPPEFNFEERPEVSASVLLKVKSFLGYTYEQRFLAIQGYMVYIFKSYQAFESRQSPLESLPIQGLHIFSAESREEKRLSLVLHGINCQTTRPSPVAIASLLQSRELASPSQHQMKQMPADLVKLAGDQSNKSIIASTFTRSNYQKPPPGFFVLNFEDNQVLHLSIYRYLRALRLRFVLEVCVAAFALCLRRGYVSSTVGIFRVGPSATELDAIKNALYEGRAYDLTLVNDEFMLPSLIKALIRDLSDSLFGSQLYDHWIDLREKLNHPEFPEFVQQILKHLPYYDQNFISFLIPMLNYISSFSEVNLMVPGSLSVVFAPNLLVPPIGTVTLQQQGSNQKTLIDIFSKIIESTSGSLYPRNENGRSYKNIQIYDHLGNEITPCTKVSVPALVSPRGGGSGMPGAPAAAAEVPATGSGSTNIVPPRPSGPLGGLSALNTPSTNKTGFTTTRFVDPTSPAAAYSGALPPVSDIVHNDEGFEVNDHLIQDDKMSASSRVQSTDSPVDPATAAANGALHDYRMQQQRQIFEELQAQRNAKAAPSIEIQQYNGDYDDDYEDMAPSEGELDGGDDELFSLEDMFRGGPRRRTQPSLPELPGQPDDQIVTNTTPQIRDQHRLSLPKEPLPPTPVISPQSLSVEPTTREIDAQPGETDHETATNDDLILDMPHPDIIPAPPTPVHATAGGEEGVGDENLHDQPIEQPEDDVVASTEAATAPDNEPVPEQTDDGIQSTSETSGDAPDVQVVEPVASVDESLPEPIHDQANDPLDQHTNTLEPSGDALLADGYQPELTPPDQPLPHPIDAALPPAATYPGVEPPLVDENI